MPRQNRIQDRPIQVSSKLLGHISEGLYRSAAAATKELVSNAFDADATVVEITTNWPSFDVFTCRDNGSGIEYDGFVELMSGGIGTSTKRIGKGLSDTLKRPLIGRLGVGILAVGQFCHSFSIETHHKATRTAFKAKVTLSASVLEEFDAARPDEDLKVGTFSSETIPYQATKTGTTIFSHDLKFAFIKRLRDESAETTEKQRGPVPQDFRIFYQQVVRARGLRLLGEYRSLIWGLASYCPIEYLDNGPVRRRVVAADHKERLQKYNFRVIVDGCELRKPILLPSVRRDGVSAGDLPEFKVFPFVIDEEVYGEKLKVLGYIYAQGGRSIQPPEIRGVELRIRDVGIGPYDRSLLDYPYVEGPRMDWISGELYAEEGLEDALTATRDSLDVLHPHYRFVQMRLFELLRGEVFPHLWLGIKERTVAREKEERRQFLHDLPRAIEDQTGIKFRVRLYKSEDDPPVTVNLRQRSIMINNVLPWPGGKARKQLLQRAYLAFEVARTVETDSRRSRQLFETLIRSLL